MLRGRHSECSALDALVAAVETGESRALVVRGEPGVGKTALLEHLAERASRCRVARAAGAESEIELAFAGLHRLCAPMLDRLDRLPPPQRDALGTAFGLRAGGAPDRFLIGLAVLSLLSEVAEEQPLLCLIDDAGWLDSASAQVLGFVARRLQAESVGIVFAVRTPGEAWSGLPELEVAGLDDGDARALLESAIAGRLDARVRDRIVAETRGNPLALLELPRGLTAAELAGGFGTPVALSGRIEESFRRRLESLPPATRTLLLVASAEPVGEPVLVWRAAARLDIGAEAAGAAEAADLCEFGARVRFRHPLVRSAAYRSAPPHERRTAHEALAAATDPELDPDRRAWHRAEAAPGPDEEVAAELERSAGRAQARGGLAAAAAFLERAAALTPDPARRTARALAAAQAELQAGAPGAAEELLVAARAGRLDELQHALADLTSAHVAFATRRGADAPPLLLAAAKRLEPLDAVLARETYLDALAATIFVGSLDSGSDQLAVARAARAGPPAPDPPRAIDLLLDGLAAMVTEGRAAGAPILRRALSAFDSDDLPREHALRWGWLACHAASEIWDAAIQDVLTVRLVEVARDAGALTSLLLMLTQLAGMHMRNGDFAEAAATIEEVRALGEATGSNTSSPYTELALEAFRGREQQALRQVEISLEETVSRGEGVAVGVAEWALTMLYNGLGRYQEALDHGRPGLERPQAIGVSTWLLPELVEAAVRSGDRELALEALERLMESTGVADADWGRGIETCARALVAEGAAAEPLYREAIECFRRTAGRVEFARAQLVYGEWLRRRQRRLDARAQLRAAHELFTEIGAEAFAERAARELLATGETARRRTAAPDGGLTAQEAQIARLARDGLSNAEIAGRLYISPRTVEYHLSKVFAKLEIGSRVQLEGALAGDRG